MTNAGEVIPQPSGGQPGGANGEIGPILSKAWALGTADIGLFVLGCLVVGLLGSITCLILLYPLMFGFVAVLQKRYKGEPAVVGDIFKGFQQFGKAIILFLLILVVALAIGVAAVMLNFIPILGQFAIMGICVLVAPAFYFVLPIAALSDVSPMDAIKKSFAFYQANFVPVLLLSLVTGIIINLGIVACGIGILFTAPLGLMMHVIAYNEYYLPKSESAA
jgi:hypothetical protein